MILYIEHYAGSLKHGMEFRPYYLAKRWVNAGHPVTIVAASFSHVRSVQPEMKSAFQSEMIDGICYQWCKTPSYHGNGVARFINMLAFVFRLFQYSFKIKKSNRPKVVIASSTYPLDIFPAWFIAKKYKAKLIFEIHDLWPLSPMELGGMSKYHPFILLMQLGEDFFCKYADAVVSMLPKALNHLTSRGMSPDKFNYVPNGIELQEWNFNNATTSSVNANLILERLDCAKREAFFTIAYLGAHGIANDLSNLILVAEILKKEKILFFLIGQGPLKNEWKKLVKEKNLANVLFFDPILKQEVSIITKLFDVNYIGLKKESLFRFGISPNKLMDYMAARRPIINAIEAGNDPVNEAGCGISVPAENPQALATAIKIMKSKSKEELERLGEKGYEFVSREHDYEKLAQRFLKIIF